jgi:hypothetical protein
VGTATFLAGAAAESHLIILSSGKRRHSCTWAQMATPSPRFGSPSRRTTRAGISLCADLHSIMRAVIDDLQAMGAG